MFIESIIALLILSIIIFMLPLKAKWWGTIAITFAASAIGVIQAVNTFMNGGQTQLIDAGKSLIFGAQYGTIDSLSALFLIILAIAAVSVAIYSRGYLSEYTNKKAPIQISLHYFSFIVMYLSMMMVVTFRDAFGFLFFWELMTISSFLLILFNGESREVRRAALNYLIIMHIGFVFLLAAFVPLYSAALPVSFDSLGEYFSQNSVIPLFVLFFIGFGVKAGIFPLHVWLPEAHPAAPSHISAFMSGVMIKMGIYGIIRVISYIDSQLFTVGLIVLSVGVATGIWGVILATLQNDIKKMLAYSSIENIGIILIGLGIGVLGKAQGNSIIALLGIGGALMHTLNHSFFKSLLFMGAGNVQKTTHTTTFDKLGGVGKRMPITSLMFLVATLAICALPPLSGFASEFLIYLGLFEGITTSGTLTIISILAIIFLALIGGLVALAFTKLYGVVFLGAPRSSAVDNAQEATTSMIIGMSLPFIGVIGVGLCSIYIFRWIFEIAGSLFEINSQSVIYNMLSGDFLKFTYALLSLIGISLLIWIIKVIAMRNRTIESGAVWGCGFTAPTPKMQYTGESFSEGLEKISGRMLKNRGHHTHIADNEIFPVSHDFDMRHDDQIDSLFSNWWVTVMRRINARLAMLRSGKVNHYILYAMLFLILIFVLTTLNII